MQGQHSRLVLSVMIRGLKEGTEERQVVCRTPFPCQGGPYKLLLALGDNVNQFLANITPSLQLLKGCHRS